MGVLCSSVDKDDDDHEPQERKAQAEAPVPSQTHGRLHNMPQAGRATRALSWRTTINSPQFSIEAEYLEARAKLVRAEKATAFDAQVITNASDIEKQATCIVRGIRNYDWDTTYGRPPRHKHRDENDNIIIERVAGQHFLGNVDLINKSELMKVAKRMPKGAHLHVHFNSCLSPKFLIEQARDLDAMWINSSHPLTTDQNYADSRIQFQVLTEKDAKTRKSDGAPLTTESNIFKKEYDPPRWMKYKLFQQQFNWTDGDGVRCKGTAGGRGLAPAEDVNLRGRGSWDSSISSGWVTFFGFWIATDS
jgi:adenosine deaminase CECR1